jgi:alanine racemase
MDQLTCIVDEDVELEDEVVLLGAQEGERITAEELAVHAETIAYEVVCSATLAVRRGARAYIDR